MKPITFFASALIFCCSAQAQVVDVVSVEKVNLPSGVVVGHADISPDGTFLLLSGVGYEGLSKLDLSTNSITQISDAQGAGYGAKVINGNTIVYRETTISDKKLRMQSLKAKNLTNGEVVTVVEPTHNLQGLAVTSDGILAINKGKLKTKQLGKEKVSNSTAIPSINNGKLMLTINGKTKEFCPNGTNVRYIWPSISPDGKKVLYFVSGNGAYVCNLDGSNVESLGILRAPKWIGNDKVVGMRDIDDGHFITSSEIIVKKIGGDEQSLTDNSVIAMYPSVTSDGKKILFTTPEGSSYIINIK